VARGPIGFGTDLTRLHSRPPGGRRIPASSRRSSNRALPSSPGVVDTTPEVSTRNRPVGSYRTHGFSRRLVSSSRRLPCKRPVPQDGVPPRPPRRLAISATLVDKADGTYELVVPPPGTTRRSMIWTFSRLTPWRPCAWPTLRRDFDGLKAYLTEKDVEGIVFHHPDGRKAKIKKRDFGLNRYPIAGEHRLARPPSIADRADRTLPRSGGDDPILPQPGE
jgi:hypothetical protein